MIFTIFFAKFAPLTIIFISKSQKCGIINRIIIFLGRYGMKRRFTARAIGLLALIICFACVFSGCASEPIASTEQEAAIVGTIGKYEVRYEELRYLVLNYKRDMAARYGEGIWDSAESAEQYKEELWSKVTDNIVSDYYAVMAMAEEYYYGGGSKAMMSDPAILDAVQATVELAVDECGGRSKYKKMLKDQYLTDYLFRFYNAAEECATELFYILSRDLGVIESDDEYIENYMNSDDFLRTNHIFLKGVSEENLALANKLHAQLSETDAKELEMIMLKGIHCADYTLTTTHGKYFARYTSGYGEEYELAAFDLGIGSLSEVVETPDGYYIILRLEVEKEYMNDNFDDFKDDIMGSVFNQMLEEYKESLTFELNDYGKTLNILEIE